MGMDLEFNPADVWSPGPVQIERQEGCSEIHYGEWDDCIQKWSDCGPL